MRQVTLIVLLSGCLIGASARADSGVLEVDWSALNKQRVKVAARSVPLPGVLSEGIREVRLPVLLPRSHTHDEKMSVVADTNFYSITLFLREAVLIVTGDRLYQQTMPSDSELEVVLPSQGGASFTNDEGMIAADFNRYGVNYSLQLECQKPKVDARCLNNSLIRQLFSELVVVGGRP